MNRVGSAKSALEQATAALAEEGVSFDNAFTCQPVCGPARACLQTGVYATQNGCYKNGISLPENTKTFDEIGDIAIDQVVIGSCTNGHYKDLAEAAEVFKGRKVAKRVRAIIIPATQDIYMQAVENGLVKIFIEAGCVVSTPTCGPCLGGHMGVMCEGERAVSTTNRNFVGRMGHVSSEIYLASPAVAAASAVTGRITDPREVM